MPLPELDIFHGGDEEGLRVLDGGHDVVVEPFGEHADAADGSIIFALGYAFTGRPATVRSLL